MLEGVCCTTALIETRFSSIPQTPLRENGRPRGRDRSPVLLPVEVHEWAHALARVDPHGRLGTRVPEQLHGTAQIPSLDQLLEHGLYVEDTERLGRDMG